MIEMGCTVHENARESLQLWSVMSSLAKGSYGGEHSILRAGAPDLLGCRGRPKLHLISDSSVFLSTRKKPRPYQRNRILFVSYSGKSNHAETLAADHDPHPPQRNHRLISGVHLRRLTNNISYATLFDCLTGVTYDLPRALTVISLYIAVTLMEPGGGSRHCPRSTEHVSSTAYST